MGFPGDSDSKESIGNEGDLNSIPGFGRSPEEGKGNTPVFFPGESHGQRSLAGYSPQGRKEVGMTEGLSKLCVNMVATSHIWSHRI